MKESTFDRPDSSISEAFSMDRRKFLKVLGGGIIVYFAPLLPGYAPDAISAEGPVLPKDFNAFLMIGEDGQVSCFTGKVEMGQGIVTSLAQMLAEELDVPFKSVNMVMGDTDLCPWDAGTYGSMSVKYFGPPLRAAAAEARAILVQLAGERLGVSPDRLETRAGVVFDKQAPEKKISYGDLTKGKKIERQLADKPVLKAISSFTISGKSPMRTDAIEKVTGTAKFAGDISLPGMLFARILRPPAHGAKLAQADTSAAEKIVGAKIVRDGDLIAVLHSNPDGAETALNAIKANFSRVQTNLNDANIFERLLAAAPTGKIIAEAGDIAQGKSLAGKVLETTYTQGYVAHAPMETHTAVANIDGGKVTVWGSTQSPFRAQQEVAEALSLPLDKVRIITPFVGGGFGGKKQ